MASTFRSITPIYTGGGIYVLYGELTDGTYFMADASFYDVRIMTEDPLEDWDESGYPEWQEARLVRDLEPNEALGFIEAAIKWIRTNKPNTRDCNYCMSDMEYIAEDIEEIRASGRTDWR